MQVPLSSFSRIASISCGCGYITCIEIYCSVDQSVTFIFNTIIMPINGSYVPFHTYNTYYSNSQAGTYVHLHLYVQYWEGVITMDSKNYTIQNMCFTYAILIYSIHT